MSKLRLRSLPLHEGPRAMFTVKAARAHQIPDQCLHSWGVDSHSKAQQRIA
jgi:hypothetical protein